MRGREPLSEGAEGGSDPLARESPGMERADPSAGSWTRRKLWARIVLIDARTSLVGVGLVILYLWALYDLPASDWHTLVRIFSFWAAVLFVGSQLAMFWRTQNVGRWLDARAAGVPVEPSLTQLAFGEIVDLPRQLLWVGFPTWLTGGFALGLHCLWQCEHFELTHAAMAFGTCASTGLFSMLFAGYRAKRELEGLRECLARELGDLEARSEAIHRISLAWKIGMLAVATVLGPAVFAGFLVQARAERPVEDLATRLQREWLAQAVAVWEEGGDEALSGYLAGDGGRSALGRMHHIAHGAAGPGAALVAGLEPSEWSWVEQGGAAGVSSGLHSANVFAWRVLPRDAGCLVAVAPWSAVSGELGSLHLTFAGVMLLATLVALQLARVAARDLHRSAVTLRTEVERFARGDLRPTRPFDSEDEIGALGRSFERMSGALGAAVARVAEAADRVEEAAHRMEDAGSDLSRACESQGSGFHNVSQSVASVDQGVREIHDSVASLATGIDGSGEVIHELSEAAARLRETAAVLSEESREMSRSLRDMSQSVKQVEASTTALASAAADTSSSMQEMASTTREVERAAEEADELAHHTVALAERGLEKVRHTMRGMVSIQEVTESARDVIYGLEERVKEIGAIVDVIDDVADETSLLALNAAIIAAKAGEHGRPFAVVADAIKKLAARVLAHTKEIEERVRAVQDETRNATGAIDRGAKTVEDGVRVSAEAGSSLEEITAASRQSSGRMRSIVSAVGEQAKAASHVAELMESVNQGVGDIRQAIGRHAESGDAVERAASALGTVAEEVLRTSQEQVRGSERIEAGVQGTREAVARIHRALREQTDSCRATRSALEAIHAETRSNERNVAGMSEATRRLAEHAQELRRDVARFRL